MTLDGIVEMLEKVRFEIWIEETGVIDKRLSFIVQEIRKFQASIAAEMNSIREELKS